MKILMLGWEYPPHITGGLGTACHGLLRGLRQIASHDVSFVLPRLFGGEDGSIATLVSAESLSERSLFVRSAEMSETAWLKKYIGACAQHNPPQMLSGISGASMSEGAYQGHSIGGAIAYANRAQAIEEKVGTFNLIHAHDWLTFLVAVRLKRNSGRPLVVHIHSTELDRSGSSFNQNIFDIERFGMQESDLVIAVSGYTRRIVVERYGIDPAKVVVIHNACEHDEVDDEHVSERRFISFIGRITQQKGPRYFVDAAARVLDKIPDARFVMAGDGDLLAAMKAHVAVRGLSDQFSFPGFLNRAGVQALLRRSSIYVMPSVSEPFGICALEAIHARVPVVLSKNCGVSELIQSASKVDLAESAALPDAIIELLTQPRLAAERALRARDEARRHTWAESARALMERYSDIVAHGSDMNLDRNKFSEPAWSE